MKKHCLSPISSFSLFALTLIPTFAHASFSGGGTGFVTPSELTIHMTSLSLRSADSEGSDQGSIDIWSGDKAINFKRSDNSLAKTDLGDLSIPEGRYSAMSMGMGAIFTVKIDGDKYQGATAGGISTGTPLYSIGSGDLKDDGSIATTGTAASISLDMTMNGGKPSSQTIFPTVICISESGSICHEGDYKIVQQGNSRAATSGATSPADLNILMDLYHAIRIDALTHSAMFSNAYPILLYGDVGASIHMAHAGTTPADMGLLFASDKSIQAIYGNSANSVQFPNGFAQVTVNTTPPGFPMVQQMAFVANVDTSGVGTATFPMTSESGSRGLIELKNFIAPVDSVVGGTCTDDLNGTLTTSAGTFTWTGQACNGGAHGGAGVSPTFNYSIQRIVDPNHLLGVCDSSPCHGSLTDPDGYQ